MDNYEKELFNNIYVEMMDFSGLDTQFCVNILELAEEDDEAYELVIRWFQCQQPSERRHYESLMADVLAKNNLL